MAYPTDALTRLLASLQQAIKEWLAKLSVPDFVWDVCHLGQEINDWGIIPHMTLVVQAIFIDAKTNEVPHSRMQRITGVENANNVTEIKDLLSKRI